MKKKIGLLLIGMLAVLLIGCMQQNGESEKESETDNLVVQEGVPSYEDDTQIEIGAYAGPRVLKYHFNNGAYGAGSKDPEGGWEGWLTEEAFQDYIDCGFTYVMPEYDGLYDVKTNGATREAAYTFEESDLYAYMEMAEKMNLPVVIGASILTSMTNTEDYRLTEDVKLYLAEMVENLSKYKMFKGFTLRDEPNIEYAKSFKAVYDYMKELNPDLYQYTAFLPIHSGDPTRFSRNYNGDLEAAYLEYIEAFSDATDGFVYDHYPLIVNPTTEITSISEAWYQNLRLVAEHALENDYDAGIVLQSCAYGPEGGENTQEHRRAITTKADAAYQVYTSLAYGMKNITWFTYWEHWMNSTNEEFYSAMVNYPKEAGGEPIKTDAYYAVKEINEEIKKFDHVFLKFDWEGTMAVTREGAEVSIPMTYVGDYQSPRIKEVKATDEAIIGCMKDEDGYDGFMIVNATDPGLNKSNSVTVTFKQTSKALIYVNGEEQTVDLKDGSYTFELEAGEGVFVIPIV